MIFYPKILRYFLKNFSIIFKIFSIFSNCRILSIWHSFHFPFFPFSIHSMWHFLRWYFLRVAFSPCGIFAANQFFYNPQLLILSSRKFLIPTAIESLSITFLSLLGYFSNGSSPLPLRAPLQYYSIVLQYYSI